MEVANQLFLKLILGVNKPTSGEVLLAPGIRMGYVNQTISTEEGDFRQQYLRLYH